VFQKKWELQYLVRQINSNVVCLCEISQSNSVCKDCNIKRHCNIHKDKYDLLVGNIREDKLNYLKSVLNKQQNIFQSRRKVNETAVKGNIVLPHLTAFKSKPFTALQFMKECLFD
jgi:hypothetical protein